MAVGRGVHDGTPRQYWFSASSVAPRRARKGVLMQRYLLSRAFQSILILFGVLFLVFFMVRLTGDPASLMMPQDGL
jgi:hypothetical protein